MPCCSDLTREQSNALYAEALESRDREALRLLCMEDLFFLLTVACKRKDIDRDWLYGQCREVEAAPDGWLDLWSREHYKSTIITFGKTIQDNLKDPNDTFGIFSHTRPIAKGFLSQIMQEYENNQFLKDLFPDVLYQEPRKEAPKWSLDNGIILKRTNNPKEATIEAWGVTDGQPTSKHFTKLVYDDIVTKESVSSPEMIKKTTDAFALSLNLGAQGGVRRGIGTRYHMNDTYDTALKRRIFKPRLRPATIDGTRHGRPVLWTRKELNDKFDEMGPYIGSCQLLQNPLEDRAMGFERDWLSFYDTLRNHVGWNFYIIGDPASEKKRKRDKSRDNDYTVLVVIGLAPDKNYYLVDGIRDRLNLTQRTEKLFQLHRKWRPLDVGYEEYGKDSDIEHIEYEMEQRNYRFNITALGGQMEKNDRIRRLVPIFSKHRFWLPHRLTFIDAERKVRDFIIELLDNEYDAFPVGTHDDMMDAISRIVDPELNAQFPEPQKIDTPSVTMEHENDRIETEYNVLQR